jgi:hypothetical protein
VNNDSCWLRYYLWFLLVTVLPVVCSAAAVTVAFAADEMDKIQIRASDVIPEDLAIVYGTGATHAEWGRTTYKISADGKVLYEKTRGSGTTGSRQQESRSLTKEELLLIIGKIQDNGFFNLNAHYSNPRIHDGWSSFISVTIDRKTHTVAIMNTSQKEFGEIASLISNLVDRKRSTKPE